MKMMLLLMMMMMMMMTRMTTMTMMRTTSTTEMTTSKTTTKTMMRTKTMICVFAPAAVPVARPSQITIRCRIQTLVYGLYGPVSYIWWSYCLRHTAGTACTLSLARASQGGDAGETVQEQPAVQATMTMTTTKNQMMTMMRMMMTTQQTNEMIHPIAMITMTKTTATTSVTTTILVAAHRAARRKAGIQYGYRGAQKIAIEDWNTSWWGRPHSSDLWAATGHVPIVSLSPLALMSPRLLRFRPDRRVLPLLGSLRNYLCLSLHLHLTLLLNLYVSLPQHPYMFGMLHPLGFHNCIRGNWTTGHRRRQCHRPRTASQHCRARRFRQ